MNQVFLHLGPVHLTAWKLIGYAGMLMFSGRWFMQMHASRKLGKPTIPRAFWYFSFFGTLCQLAYFIFGKNDSVGIMGNIFPFFVASYNVYLDLTHQRREAA